MAPPFSPLTPFDDLQAWLIAWLQPSVLVEMGVLAVCVLLAWGIAALLRPQEEADNLMKQAGLRVLFGRRLLDGVLFPLALMVLAYAARAVLQRYQGLMAFDVIMPALLALSVIRLVVKVLRVSFPLARWTAPVERTFSWMVWLALVLWVSGLLPLVLQDLDEITWKVGGTTLSVRSMIEGAISALVVMMLSLWIASLLESRLLRDASGDSLSVRKVLSNVTRGLLLFIGLLVALSVVGIDLTALSVVGGAMGVGVGLGLQKLAANYVSGFVILAERSIRIGDSVRVSGFEGKVVDITSRYTLVRGSNGVDSIVPNEMMVSNRVENLSYADPRMWFSVVLRVVFDSEPQQVMDLMLGTLAQRARILQAPAPTVALTAFANDGLEFTLGFWVEYPQNGTTALRSDIHVAILHAFREGGVQLSSAAQRVVQMHASRTGFDEFSSKAMSGPNIDT